MTLVEIEKYIIDLEAREMDFKNQKYTDTKSKKNICDKLKNYFSNTQVVCKSIIDYSVLMYLLYMKKSYFNNKRIVYTAKNLCTVNNGVLEDRIVKPIFHNNIIFVSHAKDYTIDKINNQRVFNIGGIIKLYSRLIDKKHSLKMRLFLSYRTINDSILKQLNGNEVYSLCYYDLNGLSLALSSYRKQIKFGEVQHGSIINYPPYAEPAPFILADIFYVKNKETIEYLKYNLCKNFKPEYQLIPYPKVKRQELDGVYVFYASTVEFNGFHPVFENFLKTNSINDLHIIVRLHPREKEKESIFRTVLEKYSSNFEFDNSKNWLENNKIKNLIVVSPWSSSIEDSYDNDFITITIDPVGKERYSHLIDDKQCYYSDDLIKTIENILEKKRTSI